MKLKTLADLYLSLLRDMYYTENRLTKALPRMVKAAIHPDLKNALKVHLLETKIQSERLDRIFDLLAVSKKGETCRAFDGLLLDSQDIAERCLNAALVQTAIITGCRAIERFEVSNYETLIEMAKRLGHADHVKILRETLKEEKAADALLGTLSKTVMAQKSLPKHTPTTL